ncbi:MAG: hypothetical protein IJC49_02940 [Clostridia bacterium]|nr:hypothetical protein [Clostridia bacterium]
MSFKNKKVSISVICLMVGVFLLALSAVYGVFRLVSVNSANSDNKKIVALAEDLLPPIKDSFPEERGNGVMPSTELFGVNVLGIIEMPHHKAKLPVTTLWSDRASQSIPCRYDGNVYAKNLIIGGSDAKGQFDFVSKISVENVLRFTDMEGNRYTYKVISIKHSSEFNAKKWQENESDLTLFVENTLSGEYTVVYFTAI